MTPRWHRYAFATLAVLLVAIVLSPVYWMLVTSVLPSSIVLSRRPPLLPPLDAVSFAAYAEVFHRRPVLAWMMNSAMVVAGSTVVSLTVATLAGYSLSRFHTPAQRVAAATLLLSKMLPGSLVVVPFFVMNITLAVGPLVSLIAGILILVVPRLLNYIVALYLIVIGLLGLFAANSSHIV